MNKKTYSRCDHCKKEMAPGNGDIFTHFKLKEGTLVKRIPYGGHGEDTSSPCHDCNVTEGQYHHHGCDSEDCPLCGGQAAFCDCPIVELQRKVKI
jgi:hypothetical protein